ncbi:MAG TPA: hypothetical protein VF881_00255 [Polyangiaceae bacterium]
MSTNRVAYLTRTRAPASSTPAHHNGVPACEACGGELLFAGGSSAAIEWWRCIRCGQFYSARRGCAHHPASGMRCATCGDPNVAFTVTLRRLGHEVSLHFCSKRCLTRGLDDLEGDRSHG